MKGQAAIKYVIETGHGNRERPTEDDWSRILVKARIEGYVDTVLSVCRLIGSVRSADPLDGPSTAEIKLHAEVNANRLKVAVQFSQDFELRSIAFRIDNTEHRYLRADFENAVRLPANQIVKLLFYSPAENVRTFRIIDPSRSNSTIAM